METDYLMGKPTCWTCIDGHQVEDWSVGISLHIECNGEISDECERKMDELNYDEEKCAEICDSYKPRMISRCKECKRKLNIPEFAWGLWASTWEYEPVCSLECKKKRESDFEKELKFDDGI